MFSLITKKSWTQGGGKTQYICLFGWEKYRDFKLKKRLCGNFCKLIKMYFDHNANQGSKYHRNNFPVISCSKVLFWIAICTTAGRSCKYHHMLKQCRMQSKKVMARNIAYSIFCVGGIWLHRTLKYSRHYLQHTKHLHAKININRFAHVYLMIALSEMTKVHTFFKESNRSVLAFRNLSVFTKL